MELIYLWVEEYLNIHRKGFSFSENYNVKINKDENGLISNLNIIKNEDDRNNLFNNTKIQNITVITGKNGSGKTNILDLLGLKMDGRKGVASTEEIAYFIVYHIERNRFVVEGHNFNLIKNSIQNQPRGDNNFNLISEPYSLIIEQQGEIINFIQFLQFHEDNNGFKLQKSIDYLNIRDSFKGLPYNSLRSMQTEREHTNFFNRVNINKKNTGQSAIYNMIIDLNSETSVENENYNLFNFNHKVDLIISPNMYLDNNKFDIPIKKGFVSNNFISNEFNSLSSVGKKNNFVNNFLYDYCYSLISQILNVTEKKGLLNSINKVVSMVELEGTNYKKYYLNIISELLKLLNKIEKYFKFNKEIIEVINQFAIYLNEFESEWFDEKQIVIPVKSDYFECVDNFLLNLDFLEFRDEEIQSLLNVFKVEYNPLSSGEEALLNLFSSLHYGIKLKINDQKKICNYTIR